MTIITRAAKGSQLTHGEMDTNLTDLRDGLNVMVPKAQGYGIKVDSLGTPTFPWHDLHSTIHVDSDSILKPSFAIYNGTIKGRQFTEGDEAFIEFHIPHDYVMGSEVFIHTHWSHNATTVTGGTVTWGFELMYAKGHNQDAFDTPIFVAVTQNASSIRYQHLVAETTMTSISGSATTFPVAMIEPDGVIMCRIYLDSNDITVSSGGIPEPFLHFVDLHYQSTSIGTKNKSPGFWG